MDKLSDHRWQLLKDLIFATTADFDKMHQLFQSTASQKELAKRHIVDHKVKQETMQ